VRRVRAKIRARRPEGSGVSDTDDRFRTTIECVQENGVWTATEPSGDQDVYGRGDNPREAVVHYVEALE